MQHFTDKLKIFVDKVNRKVRLSIKVNEENVTVHIIELSDFQSMVHQFEAQK